MSGENHCLYFGGFGVVGEPMGGGSTEISFANMYPYQERSTENDLEYWYGIACGYYDEGYDFRQGLMLVDVVADNSTALGRMLLDPNLNYETAGLLAELADIEEKLSIARDTFAYDLFMHYPDDATATEKLLNTIKELATIHLMIGDEFLIDALEYRFSSASLAPDLKLDEQIDLLESARTYYQKALMSFISGFSPAVGTTIYASDAYDQAVIELFNLSLERLSMCLREKSSRQLVRQMSPDASQEWTAARQAALSTIKETSTTAYLTAAVVAHRANESGLDFNGLGGDRLASLLKDVMRQGNIYNAGLNPLGYDNRYVPMWDFETLYGNAVTWLQASQTAKSAFDVQTREFDANLDELRTQVMALSSSYVSQLSSLTGCASPVDPEDPQQVDDFIVCTGEAGGDLFDCSLDLGSDEFETCVAGKTTAGVLASKYRNIKDAQTRLDQARLRRQNILAKIDLQNELNDKRIELKRSYLQEQTALLDKYCEKLKDARSETDTITYQSTREKDEGEWKLVKKERIHSTSESFSISDEDLELNTEKEKELLKLTTDYEILHANLDTAFTIKDLLLTEAEAEIDVALAAQQKNSALADFDNSYLEKENIWFLYQRALNNLTYCTERLPTKRLLRSQEAINLSEKLYYTAHYAYQAAKALEYKYLKPLVDVPVGGGRLMLTDLFKAQTPSDMETFLLKLNSYNTEKCPWGTFDPQYHTISLAYDILGLYGLPSDERRQKFAAFVNEHINSEDELEFTFSISEDNTFLGCSGLFNMKIWDGDAPSPCSSLVQSVNGVSVQIKTTQASNLCPRIELEQSGHSSLRDSNGDVLEYIPIYEFHLLSVIGGDFSPSKTGRVDAFVNKDPRTESGGTWTGSFKGRGISSSEWTVRVFDWKTSCAKTDFSRITDIFFHIDTIGQCCYD